MYDYKTRPHFFHGLALLKVTLPIVPENIRFTTGVNASKN